MFRFLWPPRRAAAKKSRDRRPSARASGAAHRRGGGTDDYRAQTNSGARRRCTSEISTHGGFSDVAAARDGRRGVCGVGARGLDRSRLAAPGALGDPKSKDGARGRDELECIRVLAKSLL
jgi:hypothetical protein